MDIFHEQLVTIKNTLSVTVSKILVWVAAVMVCAACLFFAFSLTPLIVFLGALAVYGAFKVSGMLNIEFEYIVTNGCMDIDKILNKSDRKRVVSFECRNIESIKKYDGKKPENAKVYTCTDDDSAFIFCVNPENGEKCYVVISPDEKLLSAMKPFIPRAVLREYGEEI